MGTVRIALANIRVPAAPDESVGVRTETRVAGAGPGARRSIRWHEALQFFGPILHDDDPPGPAR